MHENEKKEYTTEELLAQIEIMKKMIANINEASKAGSEKNAPQFKKAGEKIGRNDLCPCGSGKKYKKCCGVNE